MVNMIKVALAIAILNLIISFAILGKRTKYLLIFKTGTPRTSESTMVYYLTGYLTLGVIVFGYLNSRPEATWFAWAGMVIFFAGGLMQIFNRKYVGSALTLQDSMKEGFTSAQIGFYHKIRHPGKSALVLMLLGLGIATQSLWGIIVLLALFLPSLLFKISQEEQKLLDDYGERWIAYKSDTKRLIPGVL